jgi:hypothetical protein
MPDRITLSRAKGWRKPAGAITVARPSIWGNPWGIGTPGTIDLVLDGTKVRCNTAFSMDATDALWAYEGWLKGEPIWPVNLPETTLTAPGKRMMHDHLNARRKLILANLDQLRGHDLCCWCKPGQPCHADVLLRLANGGE